MEDYDLIKKDFQIKKFCMYGFLKNLRFFEAYLLIFLMMQNITLFQIGILIAIREVIVNIFEIPSGFIADHYGRKKEMYMCFIFYIISFIFFFFTDSFYIAIVAMSFYGMGEAFRSGTHKAMIYSYLESKGFEKHKKFVYGRTRSFSLIGSAISSILGVFIVLYIKKFEIMFLISIIPYILDFLLILSYPKFLDKADVSNKGVKTEAKEILTDLKTNKRLRKSLLNDASFACVFSIIKDYIQPILQAVIVGSGIILISNLSSDDNLKIILGITYAFINVAGAVASRKTYILTKNKSNEFCLNLIYISMIISLVIISVCFKMPLVICFMYLIMYVIHSMRKPIFVDDFDNHIKKSTRATMLSISSQMKSLLLIIFAPLVGYIADNNDIKMVTLILCVMLVICLPFAFFKHEVKNS